MDQEGQGYRKTLTPSQAKPKIEKYCDYQERSHQQVKRKLQGYGLSSMDADLLLLEMMQANLLNEERFAMAYARGKFKIKGWGKVIDSEDLDFPAQRDQLVALLRGSAWFKADKDEDAQEELEWAIDDLECSKSAEDADNDALYRIYNLADEQRVWLSPV